MARRVTGLAPWKPTPALRDIVRGAITSWMDQAVLSAVLERGAAEREELRALLDGGRL